MVFELSATSWALIGAALLFNVVFTALYYITSYIINSSTHIALAKENIIQLVISGIIIALFFGTQGVLSTLMVGLICSDSPAECNALSANFDVHIKVANYSLKFLENQLLLLYSKLYLFEAIVAITSSISMTLGVFRVFLFVASIHISPFIALTLIANVQVIVVEAIGYALGIVFAKESILDMVAYAIPTVFVPLGIFFRAIPWLRVTGSTIIALCFTMYFVFPMAAIFTNYIMFDAYKATPAFVHFSSPKVIAQLCGSSFGVEEEEEILETFAEEEAAIDHEVSANTERSIPFKVFHMITEIAGAVAVVLGIVWGLIKAIYHSDGFLGFFQPVSYLKAYYYYLILEISIVAQFLVTVTVATVLEFILIVTAHRSLSAVMGGETEIFGLSKII